MWEERQGVCPWLLLSDLSLVKAHSLSSKSSKLWIVTWPLQHRGGRQSLWNPSLLVGVVRADPEIYTSRSDSRQALTYRDSVKEQTVRQLWLGTWGPGRRAQLTWNSESGRSGGTEGHYAATTSLCGHNFSVKPMFFCILQAQGWVSARLFSKRCKIFCVLFRN